MAKHSADPRELACGVLLRVERDEAYSHVALDAALRQASISSRDRRLATRIVYGTLSRQGSLDTELTAAVGPKFHRKTRPFVRVCLRAALFQIRYLDRIPSHAAVDAAVRQVRRKYGGKLAGFANAVLRTLSRSQLLPPDEERSLAERLDVSDDLAHEMHARLGDAIGAWAQAISEIPPLCLRVNRSRVDLAELSQRLGAKPGRWAPDALLVEGWSDALAAALAAGECAVQDEGSQLVGISTETMGERVWDVCAGQGGKALHMADRAAAAGNRLQILATDLYPAKLDRLWAQRGLFPEIDLHVLSLDATAPPPAEVRERGPFDLVVVDAPCTGAGLLRRHPEVRWRYSRARSDALAKLQTQILSSVAPCVAAGGSLVYAVCTNTRAETSGVADAFLESQPGFSPAPLEGALGTLSDGASRAELFPHVHGTDGFYVARFVPST